MTCGEWGCRAVQVVKNVSLVSPPPPSTSPLPPAKTFSTDWPEGPDFPAAGTISSSYLPATPHCNLSLNPQFFIHLFLLLQLTRDWREEPLRNKNFPVSSKECRQSGLSGHLGTASHQPVSSGVATGPHSTCLSRGQPVEESGVKS